MRHGAKPNGGGHFVNQYTLLMDVMFPAASSGQWRALFQTDPFNHDGNDAEFYVGNDSFGPGRQWPRRERPIQRLTGTGHLVSGCFCGGLGRSCGQAAFQVCEWRESG